jgi:hypothetical protein
LQKPGAIPPAAVANQYGMLVGTVIIAALVFFFVVNGKKKHDPPLVSAKSHDMINCNYSRGLTRYAQSPERKGIDMDQTGYAAQPFKGRKCIYTCNDVSLVGMNALENPAVLNRLFPGQPVRFLQEPDNPLDSSAVQVISQFNVKIGYLPKESKIKEMVLSWLREGKPLWAEIDFD